MVLKNPQIHINLHHRQALDKSIMKFHKSTPFRYGYFAFLDFLISKNPQICGIVRPVSCFFFLQRCPYCLLILESTNPQNFAFDYFDLLHSFHVYLIPFFQQVMCMDVNILRLDTLCTLCTTSPSHEKFVLILLISKCVKIMWLNVHFPSLKNLGCVHSNSIFFLKCCS